MEKPRENIPRIKLLESTGPDQKYKDELMLFGQFVGDWDIVECRFLKDNGTWGSTSGELHWGWILEGTALQDVWYGVAGDAHESTEMGTTVRFYDPAIKAWHSIWISPSQNTIRSFIGKKVGNEIVLSTEEPEGKLEHWIFYDISENSFRWRAEQSVDNGKSWTVREQMEIVRQ